jgi:hypothetical protein
MKMAEASAELTALRAKFPAVDEVGADALPSLWAAVVLRTRDEKLIRGHGSVRDLRYAPRPWLCSLSE